jgi:hypothetical protein
MSPTGNVPERHDRHKRSWKPRLRTPVIQQMIKVLAAAGQLAALVRAILGGCK